MKLTKAVLGQSTAKVLNAEQSQVSAALGGGACGGKHSRESSGAPGLTPKELIGKTASFNASYRLAAELSKMSAKSRKQALLGMQKQSGRASATLLKPSASSGMLVTN